MAFLLLNKVNEFKLIFNYWNEGIKTSDLSYLSYKYVSGPDFKSSDNDLKFLISDLNTQLPRLKTNCTFCSSHGWSTFVLFPFP